MNKSSYFVGLFDSVLFRSMSSWLSRVQVTSWYNLYTQILHRIFIRKIKIHCTLDLMKICPLCWCTVLRLIDHVSNTYEDAFESIVNNNVGSHYVSPNHTASRTTSLLLSLPSRWWEYCGMLIVLGVVGRAMTDCFVKSGLIPNLSSPHLVGFLLSLYRTLAFSCLENSRVSVWFAQNQRELTHGEEPIHLLLKYKQKKRWLGTTCSTVHLTPLSFSTTRTLNFLPRTFSSLVYHVYLLSFWSKDVWSKNNTFWH